MGGRRRKKKNKKYGQRTTKLRLVEKKTKWYPYQGERIAKELLEEIAGNRPIHFGLKKAKRGGTGDARKPESLQQKKKDSKTSSLEWGNLGITLGPPGKGGPLQVVGRAGGGVPPRTGGGSASRHAAPLIHHQGGPLQKLEKKAIGGIGGLLKPLSRGNFQRCSR